MTEILNVKNWKIVDGVLGFESNLKFIAPPVDEIYSAVFENNYSGIINSEDIKSLNENIAFSKYPADLRIVTKSSEDYYIVLEIQAFIEEGQHCTVLVENVDSVIIDNVWYPLESGAINDILQDLKLAGITCQGRISLAQYLFLLKNTPDQFVNEVATEKLKAPTKDFAEKPVGIKAELYPYQIKGWQWLNYMRRENIGGILADEMGLGKTLQIISLIGSQTAEEPFPSLIISPTTLLENWRREFKKFAPHVSTTIHQGPNRTGFPNQLRRYQVVITSYETIVRDNSLFNEIEWQLVVCDEAQAIKNPMTKRALSVKRLPRRTGFAVTGTPIENSLTDLWSIMDFSVPSFLGDHSSFVETYENTENGASQLEAMISPLILRRKIEDVAKDLPAKIIIPQVLELSSDEALQYDRIRTETEQEFKSVASLVVLTRLRLFCAHPFLITDIPNADPALHSNKYARLLELVEEIVLNSSKVIVFTSYNKMNDIIVSDLSKRFNIYSASIDGRTPAKNRQDIVDKFSNIKGAALLVLNPIAAGTGLNITAANHVIHYNLEWNPAKEDQASARAYRRGQDRPVTIHRLFYSDSVEEAIDERLTRKRQLAGTAIIGIHGEDDDYVDILNAIQKSPNQK